MIETIEHDFINELKNVRKGLRSHAYLKEWIKKRFPELSQHYSPGLLLKLRNGEIQVVMKSISTIVPSCMNCSGIGPEAIFQNRLEHAAYSTKIEHAVASRKLINIPQPEWFNPLKHLVSADSYFLCATCNSIWTLVEPEKEDNGLWERIA